MSLNLVWDFELMARDTCSMRMFRSFEYANEVPAQVTILLDMLLVNVLRVSELLIFVSVLTRTNLPDGTPYGRLVRSRSILLEVK